MSHDIQGQQVISPKRSYLEGSKRQFAVRTQNSPQAENIGEVGGYLGLFIGVT